MLSAASANWLASSKLFTNSTWFYTNISKSLPDFLFIPNSFRLSVIYLFLYTPYTRLDVSISSSIILSVTPVPL
nr:MAG TPA: hypothetical protein [Caudoviricetes sp.]